MNFFSDPVLVCSFIIVSKNLNFRKENHRLYEKASVCCRGSLEDRATRCVHEFAGCCTNVNNVVLNWPSVGDMPIFDIAVNIVISTIVIILIALYRYC